MPIRPMHTAASPALGRPSTRCARGWAAALVAVMAATQGAGPAVAQDLPLLTPKAQASTDAAASAPGIEAEVAALRTQLERLQPAEAGTPPVPLLDEQRTLASRLALLLTLESRPTPPTPALPELPAPIAGAPPYAVADVDTLRDTRDGLQSQVDSLALQLRSLEGQINARLAAGRKAEEALRLKADFLSRERDTDKRERLKAEAEVARLEARIAAVEVTRADRDRQAVRTRLTALKAQLEQVDRDIARVRGGQHIDDQALARVAEAAQSARRQLDAQRRETEQQIAPLESVAEGGGRSAEAAQREVQALRERLSILGDLDLLESGREEAWRQRRGALEAQGTAQQAEAGALLRRSVGQLQARLRSGGDRLLQARAALRLQGLRVDGLAADAPERAAEQQALAALQSLVDTHELAQEAIGRVERLLSRTLDDLSAAAPAVDRPWVQGVAQRLADQAVALWHYELFSVSDTSRVDGRDVTVDYGVTVGKSVGVVVLFVAGWALAWGFSRLVIGWVARRLRLSEALSRVMQRWVLTLLVLVVLVAVLKLARIPLTVFAFLGGALAIGVGFGTQNIIKNLISGVIILFERKIRVGDIVTIDSVSGTVAAVDLRATTVLGFDGVNAIVPNSLLLENRVSNWSIGSPTVRRALVVGLSYGQDTRRASQVLMDCLRANPDVLPLPAPEVLFDNFGDDAQVLRLQYWVRLGGLRAGPTVDSELRHAIAEAFSAEGLVIAFPQRDVHLDLQAPLDLRLDTRPRRRRRAAR